MSSLLYPFYTFLRVLFGSVAFNSPGFFLILLLLRRILPCLNLVTWPILQWGVEVIWTWSPTYVVDLSHCTTYVSHNSEQRRYFFLFPRFMLVPSASGSEVTYNTWVTSFCLSTFTQNYTLIILSLLILYLRHRLIFVSPATRQPEPFPRCLHKLLLQLSHPNFIQLINYIAHRRH